MEALSFSSSSTLNTVPTTVESATSLQQKSSSRVLPDERTAATSKPKQSKSRNGCSTCKAKRLKCDETKPICNQCIKRKVTCGGYQKDWKWRSFAETTSTTTSSQQSRPTSTLATEKPWIQERRSESTSNHGSRQSPTAHQTAFQDSVPIKPEFVFSTSEEVLSAPDIKTYKREPKKFKQEIIEGDPCIVNPESSWRQDSIDRGGYHLKTEEASGEDIEEIPRLDARLHEYQHFDSSSSSSGASTLTLHRGPHLDTGSPEMLVLNFDRNTCGILSVKDGMHENPWRTLMWPLAQDSPALYHAIMSMSAFHGSVNQHKMKVPGVNHMSTSISLLCKNIKKMDIEESLATSLALSFADTWDTSISTGIEHIRGGSVLINDALVKIKSNPNPERSSRLRFLCSAWLYMDVLSRLTSSKVDSSMPESPLWSQIELLSNNDEIDPLLGCAGTLFPIIGRVANLVSLVRRTHKNSISLIAKANELKQELLNWSPPSYLHQPQDPTCSIQHSIQTAEAYRTATLLHLHQAVPELPSRSAASLAQEVLMKLATVPNSSRTLVVHIYPLLAAGCEARFQDDRTWILDRWDQMRQRMQISNVDRCIEVTKELWLRRDRASLQRGDPYTLGTDLANSSMLDSSIFAQHATAGEADGYMASLNSSESLHMLPFERTVRGRLHWAGVMKEHKWEILLG